tara:strand:- start:328 stop:792 length:465 start_codon:yes stop_codon:yes gene_type:complete
MSTANAAAIRRRVNNPPKEVSNEIAQNSQQQSTNNSNTNNNRKPTFQQYVMEIDQRVKKLEENIPNQNTVFTPAILDEFNSRFEILAHELHDMKDTIMKLQTFTMEVNKSMHDERIHILSDIGNTNSNSLVDLNEQPSANIKDMAQQEQLLQLN